MILTAKPSTIAQVGLVLFLSCFVMGQDLAPQFPKIVWIYAEQETELDGLEKLCLNNIKHYARQSNYELRLVTQRNISKYLNLTFLNEQIQGLTYLDKNILKRDLIQLTILQQHGGIWINLPLMLTENLDWISTLLNQKHVNNRIEDPDAVLFYQPEWFQTTSKRLTGKVQDIAVYPSYESWLVVTAKECDFIRDWRRIYVEISKQSHNQLSLFFKEYDLNPQEYLLNPKDFLKWTAKTVIKIRQNELDKNYGTGLSRKLAVSQYKVSAINSQESGDRLSTQAKGHTHLTTKYFTEVPLSNLNQRFSYLLRIPEKVQGEIGTLVDSNIPQAEHLHTAVQLACDGESVPYMHIVDGSVIDVYLLKSSQSVKVKTYSSQFITHNCSVTYESVLYQFLIGYLLPLFAFVVQVYTVRRMILVFKPQCGVRRVRRM